MAHLKICLLGAYFVTLDGEPLAGFESDKARALLAYLAVECDRPYRREALAGLFWPETPENLARTNLRSALANLRRITFDHQEHPPFLEITRQTIQFNAQSNSSIDVNDFQQAVGKFMDRGGRLLPSDYEVFEQEHSLATAVEATDLYQGDFLAGFSLRDSKSFEDWTSITRASLQRQAIELMHMLSRYFQEMGEYDQAAQMAHRQVELEPFQEAAQQQLMWVLTLNGQRTEALTQYDRFCTLLEEELGVEPLEETKELYARIIQGELPELPAANLIVRRKPKIVGENPYRGLAAFREEDAPFFHGREEFIDRLEDSVSGTSNLIVIVGSSGSGKSSTVFAGLVPRLRRDGNWRIVAFRPGSHPMQSLASALAPHITTAKGMEDPSHDTLSIQDTLIEGELQLVNLLEDLATNLNPQLRILLVIDQFEEIYTMCAESSQRHRFIEALIRAAEFQNQKRSKPFVILATMRADFMSQALAYRPFADAINRALLTLGPMSKDELYAAIEEPALKQGAALEPGFAVRLRDDVGDEPGNLPLLEFSLTLMWDHLDQGWLTHRSYEEIGQVKGALARYAEGVYLGLNDNDQESAQHIFVQLIQPGQGTEDTRRVASSKEFGPNRWDLIQYLADKRLVVTSRDDDGVETVEIIHEALICEWDRLKRWMNEERTFRIWQEGLRSALRQWEESGRDEDALLHGIPLTKAETWVDERSGSISNDELEFIHSSLYKRSEQEREETIRIARERTLERRSRTFLQVLVGVFLLASVVSLRLALVARNEARHAMESYSLSLAANARKALLEKDTSTGLVLAMAANQIENPPIDSERILLDTAFSPGPRARYSIVEKFDGVEGPPISVAISPSGLRAVTGFFDGSLVVWEIATGEELQRMVGHQPGTYDPARISSYSGVNDVAWSIDGLKVVSGGDDGVVIVWDPLSGEELQRFEGHSGPVRAVEITPGGLSVISGGYSRLSRSEPGELIHWDIYTGSEIMRFEGISDAVVDIVLTTDGRKLVSSSGEVNYVAVPFQSYNLILWDVDQGSILHRFEELDRDMPSVAIGPGCPLVRNGTQNQDGVNTDTSPPCSTTALSGSTNHNLYLWDLDTGRKMKELEGHSDALKVVDISIDGMKALSGGGDGEVILWDLVEGEMQYLFDVHSGAITDLDFHPEGSTAISVSTDGTIILWDLINAAQLNRFEGHEAAVIDIAFIPDGRYFVSASGLYDPAAPLIEEDSIRLWNTSSAEQTGSFDWRFNDVFQFDVSPDGKRILSGHMVDQSIRLWNVATGQEIRRFEGHVSPVLSIAFTPDGRRGLSGAIDGTIILWDLTTGDEISRFSGHEGGIWALDVCPDGMTALSGADDRRVIWWDLETGDIRQVFEGHHETITGIACSPNGQRALSGDSMGWLIEWDLLQPEGAQEVQGRELQRIEAHVGTGSVGRTRIAYTPDGGQALSSGWDGTLALWDLQTGNELYRFQAHDTDFLFDLSISPDGQTALSCGIDRVIIQWQLSIPTPQALQEWIKANRYIREPTCVERSLYQLEPLCSE